MKIGIILINWNTSIDTIECLESLKKSSFTNFEIIIIDNYSNPHEIEKLETYCNNNFHLKINLLKNSSNLGFGKANNIGFEYFKKDPLINYVWVLNNDTVIKPGSLEYLIIQGESNKKIGMIGSVMVYYSDPEIIQTVGGGYYYPIIGLSKLIWKNKSLKSLENSSSPNNPDYLMGSSILIKMKCLKELKGFDERYFVYGEDVDLSFRAKQLGWRLGVARNSIILHKDSGSTKDKKELFYYLFSKGNILNTKIHYPHFVPISIIINILFTVLRAKSFKSIKATIRGSIDAFRSV